MAKDQLYHSIFNHLEDIMIISDGDAKIVDANIHACNFLEIELEEIKGKELSSILSSESSLTFDEALQLQDQGENPELDVRIKAFDNSLDAYLRYLNVNNETFWILSAKRLENEEIYSKEASSIDHLTQTFNHLKLEQVLDVELSKSMRYHSNISLSLVLLEIDNFEGLVNSYGKKVSNQLIIELSVLLQETIRTSDILVRWKHAEFMVLVPSRDIFEITTFASKLREIIENYKFSAIKKITCSFGVTRYNSEDDKKEQIIGRATTALNKAIKRGRNRVEVS